MRKQLILAALAAAAAPAMAQFVGRYGVPDFDQKRTGVPNSGKMYCVPTSGLNWMAYIANRGYPLAMGTTSANWGSQVNFDHVTFRLNHMGDSCDTDPDGGTNLGNTVDGYVDYLDDYNVGLPAIVCGYAFHDDWAPTPTFMYNRIKAGGLVNMVFGYWDLDGDQWERDGAHCMTLCSVELFDPNNYARIGFKNPNTSDSYSVQSAFSTDFWSIVPYYGNFDGEMRTHWQKVGSSGTSNRKFIDKVIVIYPLCAIAGTSTRVEGQLHISQLAMLNNQSSSDTIVTVPGNPHIAAAVFHPHMSHAIVATDAVAGISPARLWSLDLATHDVTRVANLLSNVKSVQTDRRGHILVLSGNVLDKYLMAADGSVRVIGSLNPGYVPDAIAIDDKTDDLFVLGIGRRTVARYPAGNFTATPESRGYPTSMVLGASPTLAMNPVQGKLWITSAGSPSVYQLTPSAVAPVWLIGDTLDTTGMSPTGLNFTDKGIMQFASGGLLHEYQISAASGRYIPSTQPLFPGMQASGFFNVARSRTNFDPAIHTGPAWRNIEDPDVDAETVIDCPADFNLDSQVDFFDYLDFVEAYSRGNMDADINFDGQVDFFDYLDFVQAFSNGC